MVQLDDSCFSYEFVPIIKGVLGTALDQRDAVSFQDIEKKERKKGKRGGGHFKSEYGKLLAEQGYKPNTYIYNKLVYEHDNPGKSYAEKQRLDYQKYNGKK